MEEKKKKKNLILFTLYILSLSPSTQDNPVQIHLLYPSFHASYLHCFLMVWPHFYLCSSAWSFLFTFLLYQTWTNVLAQILFLLFLIVIVLIFPTSDPISFGGCSLKSPTSPFFCLKKCLDNVISSNYKFSHAFGIVFLSFGWGKMNRANLLRGKVSQCTRMLPLTRKKLFWTGFIRYGKLTNRASQRVSQ